MGESGGVVGGGWWGWGKEGWGRGGSRDERDEVGVNCDGGVVDGGRGGAVWGAGVIWGRWEGKEKGAGGWERRREWGRWREEWAGWTELRDLRGWTKWVWWVGCRIA